MKKNVINFVIVFAACFLLVASLLFQCSRKEDGTYMNCHKANMTIAVFAIIIAMAGILLFVVKNVLAKRILLGIAALSSVISAIVPGIIISLCMMPEMVCRAALRPAAIICSIIICLFAIVGLLFERKARA